MKGPQENVLGQMRELVGADCTIEVLTEDGGGYHTYRIAVSDGQDYVEDGLAHLIVKNGWSLNAIWREQHSLEDFFRARTYQAQQEAGHA